MDREHFMDFFRNDEKLEQLTPDDRIEIFLNVLLGSSDIDVKLLNELLIMGYLHYMVEITSSSKYSSPPYNSTKVGI